MSGPGVNHGIKETLIRGRGLERCVGLGVSHLDPTVHRPVNIVRQQIEAPQRWAQATAKDVPSYENKQQC